MSPRVKRYMQARGKLLDAWEPPPGCGEPLACVASTYTFDAGFFEEELIGRFFTLESAPDDGRAYLLEREERLASASIAVLVDRRHVDRSTTLGWDMLAVPVPGQACQHAKVAVLAWRDHIRLIVSSANLTPAGYRKNVEVFAWVDFSAASELAPPTVLAESLAFLERMLEAVPDRGAPDGPRARAHAALRRVREEARALGIDFEEAPDPRAELHLVTLEPSRGRGIVEQLAQLWGSSGPRPNLLWLLAPFWESDDVIGGPPSTLVALAKQGAKGLRIEISPPGREAENGAWLVGLPASYAQANAAGIDCAIYPIPLEQEGNQDEYELRPLHAKIQRWIRVSDGDRIQRELFAMGSSNPTVRGLGVGSGPRNWEANLVWRLRPAESSAILNEVWPRFVEAEDLRYAGPEQDAELEGAGEPPPPLFFRAASWTAAEGGAVLVDLDEHGEPEDWELEVETWSRRATRAEWSCAGSPRPWQLPAPRAGSVAPGCLLVRWSIGGTSHEGRLGVNAATSADRLRPDVWGELDLDTLLAILASGGSLHRALARKLAENQASLLAAASGPELDPHRRVDTSGFVVQRMRRIARAIEGLGERLRAPVSCEVQLAWRLEGPLSPRAFAELLSRQVHDPEEQAFLLADIARCVRRAAQRVEIVGVDPERVRSAFENSATTLEQRMPAIAPESSLARYLARARGRA